MAHSETKKAQIQVQTMIPENHFMSTMKTNPKKRAIKDDPMITHLVIAISFMAEDIPSISPDDPRDS